MSKIDIIQQSDVAKYQLIIDHEDFNPETDDFTVRLSWGFYGESIEIKKNEMYHDEEWNVFFMFDSTPMLGMITAECEYLVPDSDMGANELVGTEEELYRVNVDRQVLCLVTTSATACLPKANCKCVCNTEHSVSYKRTLRSDARSLYAILRVDFEIIKTSDDNIVRVRKHNLN